MKKYKKIYQIIFFIIILLIVIRSFQDFIFFENFVPIGDDPAIHLQKALNLIEETSLKKKGIYPPFLHFILAIFVTTTGSPLFSTMFFQCILFPISAIVLYILVKKISKKNEVSLIAIIIFGFLNHRIYSYLFTDGSLAQFFGSFILFPISIILFLKFTKTKKIIFLSLSHLMIFIIAGMHPIAFIISICEFFIIHFIFIIKYFKNKKIIKKLSFSLITTFFTSIAIATYYYLYTYFIPIIKNILDKIYNDQTKEFSEIDSFNGRITPPINITSLPQYLNVFIFSAGLIGVIIFLFKLIKNKYNFKKIKYEYIFIITWILFSFIFSQITFTLWPWRFSRDLTIPLITLSSLTIYVTIKYLIKNKITKIILIFFIFILITTNYSFSKNKQIRMHEEDRQIYDWCIENINNDRDGLFLGPMSTYFSIYTKNYNVYTKNKYKKMIMNINSNETKNFLKNNNIKYLLINPKPNGLISPALNFWDWDYNFDYINYLTREYSINSVGGEIIIYKINL